MHQAAVRELTLKERRGELIPIEEARATVREEYLSLKTRFLGLPTRIKQRITRLNAEDMRTIDDLIRQTLRSLSDGA